MATSRTGTTRWFKLRTKLIREREHICHWCSRELDPKAEPYEPNAIELDHELPVAKFPELEHDEDNLVLSCHPCNRAKSAKTTHSVTAGCAYHAQPLTTCPHSRAW